MFRRIALALDGAVEHAHHGHPDFRAHGRIFATLAYPNPQWGMVALTPDQQQHYVDAHPAAFVPVKGAWGLQGATLIRMGAIDEETLGEALTLAWQNAAARRATKTTTPPRKVRAVTTGDSRSPAGSRERRPRSSSR
jgi:hypothetical protein